MGLASSSASEANSMLRDQIAMWKYHGSFHAADERRYCAPITAKDCPKSIRRFERRLDVCTNTTPFSKSTLASQSKKTQKGVREPLIVSWPALRPANCCQPHEPNGLKAAPNETINSPNPFYNTTLDKSLKSNKSLNAS